MWIDGIKQIPRRRLKGWTIDQKQEIDLLLAQLNSEMPTEIHRAIRGLKYMNVWKGSEYRTFLLYIGIVVLKDFLPLDQYNHFLELFCAVTICYSIVYQKYRFIAKELFDEYIENYVFIYGIDAIGSNVHNLCHVIDDVKRFGNLNEISTYEFENALGQMKLWLRRCDKSLEQIARRISESHNIENRHWLDPNDNVFLPSVKYQLNGNSYKHINIKPNVILSSRKLGDKFF